MATFHRAIQRSVGTMVGILVATVILSFHPEGYMIVIVNMCLTALVELSISKNYALAAVFITPNAMLIAENSTKMYNTPYFATARIIDIVVGSTIGLIGTYIIGRKSASSRLPDLMAQLILIYETMATDIEQKNAIQLKKVPVINEIPEFCEEINNLQEALSIKSIL